MPCRSVRRSEQPASFAQCSPPIYDRAKPDEDTSRNLAGELHRPRSHRASREPHLRGCNAPGRRGAEFSVDANRPAGARRERQPFLVDGRRRRWLAGCYPGDRVLGWSVDERRPRDTAARDNGVGQPRPLRVRTTAGMRPRLELSYASDEGGRTGVAPINHRDGSLRGRSVRGIADCSDGDACNDAQRHSGNDHESADETNSDLLRKGRYSAESPEATAGRTDVPSARS